MKTLALVLLLSMTAFAEMPRERMEEVFAEANDLFRQANERSAEDPGQAYNLYQAAALRYERLLDEGEVRNGRLHYNLGNAYFQMDELGRAILNYRRAERYLPGDLDLLQSLSYARSRTVDAFDDSTETRLLKTLLFWHYDLSPKVRLLLFVAVWVALWALAAARVLRSESVARVVVASFAGVAALLGLSLAYDAIVAEGRETAVVTAPETIARRGDAMSYEPAFTEPLHAGAELDVLDQRAGWLRIALPDGRTAWIPAQDAALITP